MSDDSEEACLVRPRSPSLTSSLTGIMQYTQGLPSSQHHAPDNNTMNNHSSIHSQGSHSTARGSQSESGELIDYSDDVILSQFHADAIKQAGFGKFQLIASIISGLGLAGHAIQVYAIFYIIPSAEVEYCILDTEKSWLGSITLLGMAIGALLWGGLAGRAGRRKALLSCLAVCGVFSVIAAFMPTYGTFMMARFCAATGIGGALPTATVYLCELTPVNFRARMLGLLGALGTAGGMFAGAVATVTVPETGQKVIQENKEHFSAWHRYLLLSTLPTFASILGLFWLPESPRYLLENSREVEALTIYQKIYQNNRTRGGYSLTELELPGTRTHRNLPSSVLQEMATSITLFFGSFFQLFNKVNLRRTLLLFAAWTTTLLVYHGLTVYVAEYSKSLERENYSRNTINKDNVSYENIEFNKSIENTVYTNCRFMNCTFRRMFISHVVFNNCTFQDTEFTNVKTSRTQFKFSILDDVGLIDTDLTERHFVDCLMNNVTTLRLLSTCDRDFEYNIYLDTVWKSHFGALLPAVVFMLMVGEGSHRFGRCRAATLCFGFAISLTLTFSLLYHNLQIIWTAGSAQGLMLAGIAALTLMAIESYTTSLRCTAIGFFVAGGHFGALVGAQLYAAFPVISSKVAAIVSALFLSVPITSAIILRDPCLLL
ncbi:synaptic vesicle glycoprotein 2A-like [Toxorhynchites rutilus septentrionalis]|uniref:synaptic vesicle glycoprotein 2A-like n=1 Tax=Toxorhynchites rutilus septentrionalis TaxID=329112 RepID=UPI002479F257|nr:synaptic vesicle glycoprotein 2A-like [Toxorhynchites rutilus septentrionalis]